ncbi:MAG: L-serine ammonia-lyase, iron-sulfur-dependent, subunit alpha [Lachnospiraceae bacterium]|nr:L-serine ammonia-lyase, iron-sulfur-dependent, subunit alpha [Lachnospiraceae bacterium]
MNYEFHHGKDLCEISRREGIPVSEIMLRNEMEKSGRSREEILDEMNSNLTVMRESVRSGLDTGESHHGLFTGGDAVKMMSFAKESNMGEDMASVVAAAMAVVEFNASMGKIVAAPTAGASGILPAVLIVCGRKRGFDDEKICRGLFTAGAIGCIIAKNACIAGASGGCQAETGSAAAMAAGALAELCGADVPVVLDAAAIALKNIMGLVCDPVGGLVECPCVKRNAIGAVNAVLSCDLALAGVRSLIPFDEVVSAMQSVGCQMHSDLKETARGGLAATPTAQRLSQKLI